MKSVIVLAAAVAGVVVLRKKFQETNAQKNVWNQATDKVD